VKRRQLGSTPFMVSPLGLGTVKFGRASGVKYPMPVRIPSDLEAAEFLAVARDLGINLIDTAPAYGNAEERLGKLLRGQRDDWVIVTKAGEEFIGGESRFDFSPRGIRASVERSLMRLQTDRVEVLLIHSDGLIEADIVSGGIVTCLNDLKREGKVLLTGISTKTLDGAMRAVAVCDVVMVTLNPGCTQDLPAIDAARAAGKGVLIKKAFGSGHLAGSGKSAAACLEFSLGTPGVSSVIIGTTNPDHLRENVAVAVA